jgi:hypothetical protein
MLLHGRPAEPCVEPAVEKFGLQVQPSDGSSSGCVAKINEDGLARIRLPDDED